MMPPRKKKSKTTFEAIESDLRSMDFDSVVDIIKECCSNGHEDVIMPFIEQQLNKKKSGKKNGSFLIEYEVKGRITEWDEDAFTDCYGDEVEEAERIEEEAVAALDCKDRKKGAIFQDIDKANIEAEAEMKRQIKRVKKNDSNSLTLLSKHYELGPDSKVPDVSPISKSLVNGRVTLKATVKFVLDGVGADLKNLADVDISVSVVEL